MTTTDPGPRSGDDTYDLIENALAELAHRRGARPRVLPRSLRQPARARSRYRRLALPRPGHCPVQNLRLAAGGAGTQPQ
jgi:hypothetical protein